MSTRCSEKSTAAGRNTLAVPQRSHLPQRCAVLPGATTIPAASNAPQPRHNAAGWRPSRPVHKWSHPTRRFSAGKASSTLHSRDAARYQRRPSSPRERHGNVLTPDGCARKDGTHDWHRVRNTPVRQAARHTLIPRRKMGLARRNGAIPPTAHRGNFVILR